MVVCKRLLIIGVHTNATSITFTKLRRNGIQNTKKYRQLRSWRWNIALCDTPVEDLLQGKEMKLRWLKHEHSGGWFADPFILSANDREVEFLVEEFVYADRKGCISRLVADRKSMELKEIHPVLDIGCHLSFPP